MKQVRVSRGRMREKSRGGKLDLEQSLGIIIGLVHIVMYRSPKRQSIVPMEECANPLVIKLIYKRPPRRRPHCDRIVSAVAMFQTTVFGH